MAFVTDELSAFVNSTFLYMFYIILHVELFVQNVIAPPSGLEKSSNNFGTNFFPSSHQRVRAFSEPRALGLGSALGLQSQARVPANI